jgi:hypothetical protein
MPELAEFVPINNLRTPCADRNDKLGWTDGFAVSFDGISLGVRSNDSEFLQELRESVPQGKPWANRKVDILLSFLKAKESDRKGVRHYHVVYQDWDRVARTFDLEEALNVFSLTAQLAKLQNSIHKVYIASDLIEWRGLRILLVGQLEAREPVKEALRQRGAGVLIAHAVGLDRQDKLACAVTPEFEPVQADVILLVEPGTRRKFVKLTAAEAALQLLVKAHGANRHPHFAMVMLSAWTPKLKAYSVRLAFTDDESLEWLAKRLKA